MSYALSGPIDSRTRRREKRGKAVEAAKVAGGLARWREEWSTETLA